MRRVTFALAAGAAVIALSACSSVQNQRGYVPSANILDTVVVGTDTKATVSEKLGNPSVASTFNNDIWYYISSNDVQAAFFQPYSVDRDIVAVEFAPTGEVADIQHYGLEDGRVVNYIDRETPTRGRDLSILQQIFNAVPGNIGAPPPPVDDRNAGGGGGGPLPY